MHVSVSNNDTPWNDKMRGGGKHLTGHIVVPLLVDIVITEVSAQLHRHLNITLHFVQVVVLFLLFNNMSTL